MLSRVELLLLITETYRNKEPFFAGIRSVTGGEIQAKKKNTAGRKYRYLSDRYEQKSIFSNNNRLVFRELELRVFLRYLFLKIYIIFVILGSTKVFV